MKYQMFKSVFANQKKQRILNYQIKMIEQCQDSLFVQTPCDHDRYLTWHLNDNIRQILQGFTYRIWWIGNDINSYIYAYFYILIIGCCNRPPLMLELKNVLYELAQKYLAQYEQKLLIQFLCLISYSQDRYVFFRKYSKVQSILLKLFKQIEQRHLLKFITMSNQNQKNSIKQKQTDQHSTKMINSYQSIQPKNQKQQKIKNSFNYLVWYDIYRDYFPFLKSNIIMEGHIKMKIILQQTSVEEFIVSTEKKCFFVIEFLQGKQQNALDNRNKSQSIIEQSKEYLSNLINQEMQNKKNQISNTDKKNQTLSFTPKFITSKKKMDFIDNDFYRQDQQEKKVQVQILNIQQFNESLQNSKQISINQKLQYQKPPSRLKTQGNYIPTVSIEDLQQKVPIIQQIKSHPLFQEFKQTKPFSKPSNKPAQSTQNSQTYIPLTKHFNSVKANYLPSPRSFKPNFVKSNEQSFTKLNSFNLSGNNLSMKTPEPIPPEVLFGAHRNKGNSILDHGGKRPRVGSPEPFRSRSPKNKLLQKFNKINSKYEYSPPNRPRVEVGNRTFESTNYNFK